MKTLNALVLGLSMLQEPSAPVPQSVPAPSGLALEREVRATYLDAVGRERRIHRRESVLIRGASVVVNDLTFGERLVIRADQKKILLADPLGGRYSEYTFDEAASIRKAALDELRSARARVPGTADEKEIDAILEGFDQFATAPKVELKTTDSKRELIINGEFKRLSVDVDPKVQSSGTLEALAAIGAFHPAVAEQLKNLGGLPIKGRVRYVLFMDRVLEEFEVISVKPQEIPDSAFELPKGLTKVPLKGFGRPPERKPPKPAITRPEGDEKRDK